MEWGAKGLEDSSPTTNRATLGQPVHIDANVRLRKKSGVMVGKHTAQTSRPTILDFGQSSENVNYPEASGAMAEADTTADVGPVLHARSASDDVTHNSEYRSVCVCVCACVCVCVCVCVFVVVAILYFITAVPQPHWPFCLPPVPLFEDSVQCKLLDVAVGRSKVHVTRHRSTKKRGASKKEALFLHTGDPERFGDRKVDPANPLQVDRKQVVRTEQTGLGRSRASTGLLRLPQEDRSRCVCT